MARFSLRVFTCYRIISFFITLFGPFVLSVLLVNAVEIILLAKALVRHSKYYTV